MRKLFIIFYIIYLGNTQHAFSQAYQTTSGNVEFLSKAALNEFKGKSDQLNGLIDLDKNLVDFYIDLNTLQTGIGLRDRHMRENYLETTEFPYAEFTGKVVNMDEALKEQLKNGKEVMVDGEFKIHGVSKDMKIKGTLKQSTDGEVLELSAQLKVLLGDHGIAIPKVMFYELSEEQTITITVHLKSP
ncbi:YceI family protein [Echinicola sp. 20G]|uniref:YceI family protein n=1 Tax=Echinicola sp. 20G TaxID=2781961 RepID=UPI00191050DD|nr:YceI family protein [Echinicola sp. 20G]